MSGLAPPLVAEKVMKVCAKVVRQHFCHGGAYHRVCGRPFRKVGSHQKRVPGRIAIRIRIAGSIRLPDGGYRPPEIIQYLDSNAAMYPSATAKTTDAHQFAASIDR